MILLADVNHPGSQKDLVSNWESAYSLVEDAVSGAEVARCLLALAVALLPLPTVRGWAGPQPASSLLGFLNPLFCEWASLCLRLELFTGKVSLSLCVCVSLSLSFFFALSSYPTVWVAISH